MYEVVDNFLHHSDYQDLKNLLFSKDFYWHYNDHISATEKENPKLYYFVHTFFSQHAVKSQFIKVIDPIINKLDPFAIHRIKANLYPNTNEYIEHGLHRDLIVPHRGAVFYVNTNNGFTILEDGTKIESVRNRILFFNSNEWHCSTSCTDEKVRITINFNYF